MERPLAPHAVYRPARERRQEYFARGCAHRQSDNAPLIVTGVAKLCGTAETRTFQAGRVNRDLLAPRRPPRFFIFFIFQTECARYIIDGLHRRKPRQPATSETSCIFR